MMFKEIYMIVGLDFGVTDWRDWWVVKLGPLRIAFWKSEAHKRRSEAAGVGQAVGPIE